MFFQIKPYSQVLGLGHGQIFLGVTVQPTTDHNPKVILSPGSGCIPSTFSKHFCMCARIYRRARYMCTYVHTHLGSRKSCVCTHTYVHLGTRKPYVYTCQSLSTVSSWTGKTVLYPTSRDTLSHSTFWATELGQNNCVHNRRYGKLYRTHCSSLTLSSRADNVLKFPYHQTPCFYWSHGIPVL